MFLIFRDYGIESHYVYADLSKRPEVKAMCKKIHKYYPEGADILINNAGNKSINLLNTLYTDKETFLQDLLLILQHSLLNNKS